MACAFEHAIMMMFNIRFTACHGVGLCTDALAYGRAITVQDDAILSLRKPDENVNELSEKKTACACRQFLWRNPCIQCVNNCLGRLDYTDVKVSTLHLTCHWPATAL